MNTEERATVWAQAERALRRGDLSQALRLYQQVAAAFPADASVREKLRLVQESLQPAELTTAKARAAADPVGAPSSPVADAERLVADGKLGDAVSAYRRLLSAQPQNQLLQERLSELFAMVQAQAPRVPVRSAEVALTELLDRVGLRKRRP